MNPGPHSLWLDLKDPNDRADSCSLAQELENASEAGYFSSLLYSLRIQFLRDNKIHSINVTEAG